MARTVKLSVVRDFRKQQAAKELRGAIYGEIRKITSGIGDDLSGFAFMAWSREGTIYTALNPGRPYGRAMPEIMRDALSQHITADLIDTPTPPKDKT